MLQSAKHLLLVTGQENKINFKRC